MNHPLVSARCLENSRQGHSPTVMVSIATDHLKAFGRGELISIETEE